MNTGFRHALFRIALVPQAVVTRCNFRWLTFSSQSTFNHSISNFGLFISPQTHDHQKKVEVESCCSIGTIKPV